MLDISVSDPETHTVSKVSAYVDVRGIPHPCVKIVLLSPRLLLRSCVLLPRDR